jgi:hypothetical protein
MEIGKTNIGFLSFHIKKRESLLQEHILKSFDKFPDIISDKTQLQRLLGCLNYVRPFYKGYVEDIIILQCRLKKSPPPWTTSTTEVVKRIKTKVKTLPALTLLSEQGQYIIETDASNDAWGGVLVEKIEGK